MKSCRYCPRTFVKTEHLHRHERSHTGEKPYPCHQCGRRYARSDVLLRHVKFFHSQETRSPNGEHNAPTTTPQNAEPRREGSSENPTLESISVAIPVSETELTESNPIPAPIHEIIPEEAAVVERPLTTDLDALATASMLQAHHDQPYDFPSDNIPDHDHQADTSYFDFLYNNVSMLDFLEFPANATSTNTVLSSSSDRASNIPLERFAQVARLWPGNKTRVADQVASRLWVDVVAYKGDNICTDIVSSGASPTPLIGEQNEWKWGMDEDKRLELIREFLSESAARNESVSFPPTRLLNLGLDIAFRQPHSLLPFIHRPTFSAKSASNSTVFSLCLLGLVLLDSRHVRDFALAYLPVATEKCCAQLAEPSIRPGGSVKLVQHLTSATLLLMAWSICSNSGPSDEFLSQMLYNQTINVAQLSGFFAPRQDSSSLGTLLEQVRARTPTENDDVLWKAWARVESVKRLISTLVMTDAWWAYNLGAEPLIRPSVMQFEMSCSADLFQASSARPWRRLIDSGVKIVTEPIIIHPHSPSIPLSGTQEVSPIGISGLLATVWIRILQVRRGMGSAALTIGQGPDQMAAVVPASEDSGKILLCVLNDIYTGYSRFLRYKNPNCITMWHLLNLDLLANLSVFELAAGRNGAESAHTALANIAAWSRTWYARRACLHAAGIYSAMSRRRINDGTMFHSETSLFNAALVLGLYVFMMQPNEIDGQMDNTDTEPYELLNEIDWLSLNGHDVATFSPTEALQDGQASAARKFLREGGVISFSGTICEGGYNAAKMILLEFASLLEEVGKWNAKGLCHILRIMSDSLLDMEDRPGD